MPTPADSSGANSGASSSAGAYLGHGARLDALLNELMRRTPELEAAAVVTADGLPMSSALPAGMDEDRVAAMSAALLSLGERAAEGLGRGGLSQVHIQGDSGGVWLLAAGDDAVLVGVSGPDAKAGLVLYELRRATAAVGTALAADELEEFAERTSRAAMSAAPEPVAPPAPAAPVSALPPSRPSGIAAEPATIVSAANGSSANGSSASWLLRERLLRERHCRHGMARVGFGGLVMRLDGSLEDFGLPDVLQLLSQTRKSGALHLLASEEDRKGVIRLGDGAIDAACSDLRRQVLARRLVGAGLVSDDALSAAADDVRAGAPSLLRALLDRSGLSSDEVNHVAADQATDAVCELLRWNAGTFSFMVGEDDPDGLTLGLNAEELVAEGHRRMQVWPNLTSHIPSPDTVLRLAPSPAFDPSCTREEWGLLALVDGSRSVSEIVALLGRSEFALAGALAALVERGLLTVAATGSGLEDLQRRQAIIAGLESAGGMTIEQPVPTVSEPDVATFDAPVDVTAEVHAGPSADVPQARDAEPVHETVDSASAPQAPEPVTQGAYDRPMTNGSAALDTALDTAPETAPAVTEPARGLDRPHGESARGLDSAVTKSLVLRLIAGVRGL